MILNFKTGKLPFNFIALGVFLFVLGAWRMAVLDWKGVLFFVLSLPLLFLHSGVMIDVENKRIKKYTGFYLYRKGEWMSIDSIRHIQVIKTRSTQKMNVLTISRSEMKDVYRLIAVLSNSKLELLVGEKEFVFTKAQEITSAIGVETVSNIE